MLWKNKYDDLKIYIWNWLIDWHKSVLVLESNQSSLSNIWNVLKKHFFLFQFFSICALCDGRIFISPYIYMCRVFFFLLFHHIESNFWYIDLFFCKKINKRKGSLLLQQNTHSEDILYVFFTSLFSYYILVINK